MDVHLFCLSCYSKSGFLLEIVMSIKLMNFFTYFEMKIFNDLDWAQLTQLSQ